MEGGKGDRGEIEDKSRAKNILIEFILYFKYLVRSTSNSVDHPIAAQFFKLCRPSSLLKARRDTCSRKDSR